MLDINEKTDAFERSIVKLVNDAELPIVNIELVLNKVLYSVREVKVMAIREAKSAKSTEDYGEGVNDDEKSEQN